MISLIRNICRRHLVRVCVLYTLVLLCCPPCVSGRNCLQRDQCSCAFDDDQSLIILNSLGRADGTARFLDILADDGSTYSYNPCYPFAEGGGSCSQAAVCATTPLGDTTSIGDAQSAQFKYDGEHVEVGYTTGTGIQTTTQVILKCHKHACEPEFVADGSQGGNNYQLTITTVCACPNRCSEEGPIDCVPNTTGLSGGGIILIIFFACVFIYLICGTGYLAFGRKARGKEMIPNVELWTSLPGLVKDGVLFTLSPCLGIGGYTSK